MTDEQLKTAVQNISAYLEECYDESNTVEITAKVLKSIKDNYEELIKKNDLINRKDAKIAELQSELIITKNNFDNAKDRYDEAVKIGQKMNEKLIDAYKKLQTAKSEAVKEVAERLRKKAHSYFLANLIWIVEVDDIKEVVKEMVGEEDA